MATFENHILYYKPTCPFCTKVVRFMESAGITCEMRNTLEEANAQDLVAIGGKKQVPCLVIDGKALYESDDIIAYFAEQIA